MATVQPAFLPRGVAVAVAGVVEQAAGQVGPGGDLGDAVVGERVEAHGQARPVGHPVVHLDVDVGVVIAHPGRVVAVEPQPLEARAAGCRATRRSSGIGRTGGRRPRVRGRASPVAVRALSRSQVSRQRCPADDVPSETSNRSNRAAVVGDMGAQQGVRPSGRRRRGPWCGPASPGRGWVAVALGRVGRVVGAAAHDHGEAPCSRRRRSACRSTVTRPPVPYAVTAAP